MNKYLIFIFSTMLSFSGYAQEIPKKSISKIIGSKELPLELNLTVNNLGNTVEIEQLLPIIFRIDSYARILSKEDIFLIGKIEIYKSLLKSDEINKKALIDGNSISILKESISKTREPFVKWFLKALLADSETLINSAVFKDYLLQKNNGRLESIENKKIDKKVQLLYRWITKLSPESPDFQSQFNIELAPILMNTLLNVETSFLLMAKNNLLGALPPLVNSPGELKFFHVKNIVESIKLKPKKKTVDEILGPLTDDSIQNEVPSNVPEPSKEDWINEEVLPAKSKNLPNPSNDADWLQDF
jgi:hypothetical protein